MNRKTIKLFVSIIFLMALTLLVGSCSSEFCNHNYDMKSCTEPAFCTICGEASPRPVGHRIAKDVGKKANCVDDGLTDGKHCIVCNEVLVEQEIIPALGHEVVIDEGKSPTCAEEGYTDGEHCSRCNAILIPQEKLDIIEHVTDATSCLEAGNCIFCHVALKARREHKLISHEGKAPTCEDYGWTEYKTCQICNYSTYREIAPLGHTEVYDPYVEPTCTSVGYERGKHCKTCGKITLPQKEIPKEPHNLKDYICTVCGSMGDLLYSFGAISDTHLGAVYNTHHEKLKNVLNYCKNEGVSFVGICGDLTGSGSDYEYEFWKNLKKSDGFNEIPIYEIAGNHDARPLSTNDKLSDKRFEKYTGKKLFYTIEKGEDVFIFLSTNTWDDNHDGVLEAFSNEDLQALYEVLEANRNKRCFIFEHYFYAGGSGNPNNSYSLVDALKGTQGKAFINLLKHYKNAIFFHGHSHFVFETENEYKNTIYDNALGIHSIHIPSLNQPTKVLDGERVTMSDSEKAKYAQGYIIDVYDGYIHVRGVNFATGESVDIATYILDTTLKNVEAGTFVDSTGIINTK